MNSSALYPAFDSTASGYPPAEVQTAGTGYGSGQSERLLFLRIGGAAFLLCTAQLMMLKSPQAVAEGVGYLCYAVTSLFCMLPCLLLARRAEGTLRLRWYCFALANLATAVSFLFPVLQRVGVVQGAIGHFEVLLSGALSRSLYLLAATLFFSGASRRMSALKIAQTLLFGCLHFAVIFAPTTHDHFAVDHLAVSTAVMFFLLITAITATAGANTLGERRFLRLLSLYLGLRFLGTLLMNQVAYTWLHHTSTSIWDVPWTLFNMIFMLVALSYVYRPLADVAIVRPTLFVRNLMPSFLAMGNVVLGLLVYRQYPILGLSAVLLAVTCYVLRTVMLLSRTAEEGVLLHQRNRQLEELAGKDTLTGVGNRRSLVSAMGRISRSKKHGIFSLVLVDTDGFKQANDLHGHLYGDSVLVAIAAVLRKASAKVPESHCARFGGDEFALLLPDLSFDATLRLAEHVRREVKNLEMKSGDGTISISVGATVAPLSTELSLESLMSRADEALYRAKAKGRNRVEMAAPLGPTLVAERQIA